MMDDTCHYACDAIDNSKTGLPLRIVKHCYYRVGLVQHECTDPGNCKFYMSQRHWHEMIRPRLNLDQAKQMTEDIDEM